MRERTTGSPTLMKITNTLGIIICLQLAFPQQMIPQSVSPQTPPAGNASSTVRQPAPSTNLDLSSTQRTVQSPSATAIKVGGIMRSFSANELLTPAEGVA